MAEPTNTEISTRAAELWAQSGQPGLLIAQSLTVFKEWMDRAHMDIDPSFLPLPRQEDRRPELLTGDTVPGFDPDVFKPQVVPGL